MIAYLFLCGIVSLLPAFLGTHWLYVEYTKYPEGIKGSPKKKEAIEKAKTDGRYAVARLVKCGPRDNDPPYDMRVKYEYVYNKKTYHMRFDYRPVSPSDHPPTEMEVYFRKSPKYAKRYSEFGHMETERIIVFFALWVTFSVILFILLSRKVKEAGLL